SPSICLKKLRNEPICEVGEPRQSACRVGLVRQLLPGALRAVAAGIGSALARRELEHVQWITGELPPERGDPRAGLPPRIGDVVRERARELCATHTIEPRTQRVELDQREISQARREHLVLRARSWRPGARSPVRHFFSPLAASSCFCLASLSAAILALSLASA